jgi:crotonobetainyl-CoA:carnitine CoA-transferase CaiB-like acyl-CoA transferase
MDLKSDGEQKGALHDIRVLDLTSNISGPSATAILGDLGAEVIKIERPGKGDDARGMGPFLDSESAYFLAINRNKNSIVIDIRKKEGHDIIKRLVKQVDVVVENFRRGVLEKYSLDAHSLSKENPRLIYCSLSAYGEDGPDAEKAGYDAVLQARTGMISITGSRTEEPARSGVSVLDMGSGMWSVIAILSALHHRSQTGEGQIVGSSLFETGIYWMNYHLMAFQATQVDPKPQGTSHAAFAPYGTYQTADNLILIGISNDSLFERLVKAIGQKELAHDPRFVNNTNRLANRNELDRMVNEHLSQHSSAYWLPCLESAGIPCSIIQKVSQVLNDPQLEAINMLQEVAHTSLHSVKIPRIPVRFSKSPTKMEKGAPLLGEHTSEVLKKYGISDEELEEYRQKGVIH